MTQEEKEREAEKLFVLFERYVKPIFSIFFCRYANIRKVEEDWRGEREESGGGCSAGRKVFRIG
jgi:hypothetical protein